MSYGLTRLDSLFSELFRDAFSENMDMGTWNPRVNVTEDENSFLVEAELPGIEPDNVKLQVENGVLYISGSTTTEREIKNDNTKSIVRERHSGHFRRSIRLGPAVDSENITAKMVNGILNVNIPKREPPKKIDIVVE